MTGPGIRHFALDLENNGFWPLSLPECYVPTSILEYRSETEGERAVLLGGADGFIRKFSNVAADDDGVAVASHIAYGPIRLGNSVVARGRVDEIDVVLASESGPVTVALGVGETAESAVKAADVAEAAAVGGRNSTMRPMRSGVAMTLRLAGAGEAWAVDGIQAVLTPMGRTRK